MIGSRWLQRVSRKFQHSGPPSRPIVRLRAYRPVVEQLELRVLLDVGVNRPFVAQVYRDVLQREGTTAELASWSDLLDKGTSRAQVTRLIETSAEYQTLMVKGLFGTILHRLADASGLNAYVGFLGKGATVEQVEALLTGSPEYFQSRGGGTDDGFLTALYQDVLGRPIDAAGQATFRQALANGASRTNVAALVLSSTEFHRNVVQTLYRRYLHRAADSGGLFTFVTALQHGARDENVAARLIGSDEYFIPAVSTVRFMSNAGQANSHTILTTVSVTQVGITVFGTTLSVSGFPSPTMAGAAGRLIVTAKDGFNNVATGYRGTVHFTSSDPQASLPADYTFTSSDRGTHTFAATFKTAGSQSLTVTDTTTPSLHGTQAAIAVSSGAASILNVAGFPAPTLAGTAGLFSVTALDAYGNTVTGYTGTVAFVSSSQSATLPGAYTFTRSDNGTHVFSATLNMTGTQSLTAVDITNSGLSGTQSGITITQTAGKAYYVSLSGSDNNSGTVAQPFRTLNHAASVLHPGDALYIRAGTYAESLVDVIPAGTSWAQPVRVSAYPGETVTLLPPPSSNPVLQFQQNNVAYVEVDNLILDANNVNAPVVWIDSQYNFTGSTPNHIRLLGCELRNANDPSQAQGVLITSPAGVGSRQADYNEFINLKVHNIGNSDKNHGFYISSNHNLIDGCESYVNAGEGIQIYKSGGVNGVNSGYNIVRNSKFHDNGWAGGVATGILVAIGNGNLIYNNVMWNNFNGIQIDYGATNTQVYNNTIYLSFGDAGIRNGYTGATASVIRNNILYQNANHDNVLDYVTDTIMDHNLVGGTNPLFVNAGVYDFHLQVGSPAIDAGATLPLVPADFDGITRPQASAYDIGAFEYHGA